VDVEHWQNEHQGQAEALKAHLTTAQAKMKHYADLNCTACEFAVGDSIYLKLQPYARILVVNLLQSCSPKPFLIQIGEAWQCGSSPSPGPVGISAGMVGDLERL
jgi:hypothetical protein